MERNLKVSFVNVFVFVLSFFSIYSQNTKIDSLKQLVETGAKDTIMVTTMNSLSSELLGIGDATEALKYAKKANELASELNYIKGKAYALKWIGIGEYYQGNFLEVFQNLTESLKNFEIIKDSTGIANLLNNLGTAYLAQGSNVKAIDYYLRSLRISEKLNNPIRIATALVNIAQVYSDNIQDYDKTMDYYNQASPYLSKLDSVNDAGIFKSVLLGTGQLYFRKGDYENALKKFEEALPITENTFYYSENLTLLGQTYSKLGKIEKAIDFIDKAHAIAIENEQQLAIVKALIEKGDIYKNNNSKKAIKFYLEAELLAKEMQLSYELADIYDGISRSYINLGDYKNGYAYQTKFLIQKDSLFNLETNDKMRGLQFDFDLQKKEDQIQLLEKESEIQVLKEKKQKNIIYASIIALILIILLAISFYRRYKFTKETNLIIEAEKNRSENLLLNILPKETAKELKENGKVQAKKFDSVTVLFTDFKGFTSFSAHLSPENLVKSVDYYFSNFDKIIEKYGLEKIKTIGDAYMCAGGLPFPSKNHANKMVLAAFEIAQFIEDSKKRVDKNLVNFDIRIGINTGPVVAGVVGIKKFAYDIWGDTVNVASRMESNSEPGKINVSENTYELIKDSFNCVYRGEIAVKNKGMMKMYFVESIKNDKFMNEMEESA